MNSIKKLLSLLFVFIMLFSAAISAAEETQKSNSDKFTQTVEILKNVGIDIGFSDENKEITREKLAEYALALTKIEKVQATGAKFIDVPVRHYAADIVHTVEKNGLMTGFNDNTFRLEEIATTYQFGRVLLHMLDYSILSKNFNWTEDEYNRWLLKTSLLYKVSGAKLTEGAAAQMLLNMLTEPVVIIKSISTQQSFDYSISEDKNYLTEKCNMEKNKGILQAVGETSLMGIKETTKGKVVIDETIYRYEKSDIADYLGYTVEYFATNDINADEQTLLYFTLKTPAEEIIVEAEEIIDFADDTFTFYKNDKINTKTVNKNKILVILNGKRANIVENKTFCPTAGEVRLVDYDGDGVFDTAFITSKIYYNLSQVVHDTYTFIDKDTGYITVGDEDSIECYVDGEQVDITAISNGNIISVQPNEISYNLIDTEIIPVVGAGNTGLKIKVLDNYVTGVVTQTGDDGLMIYSEEDETNIFYEYSLWYTKMLNAGFYKSPGLDSLATLYIDGGKIINARANSIFKGADRKYTYGYLLRISDDESLLGSLQFKLFTEHGEMAVYEIAENFRLNGMKASRNTILNNTKLYKNGELQRQLITFDLDDNDKITDIFIATDRANPTYTEKNEKDEDVIVENPDYSSSYIGYDLDGFSLDYAARTVYRNGIRHLYTVNDNSTKIFVIPTDSEDEKHFMIRNKSYLVNTSTYTLSLYDVQKNFVASACVVFVKASSGDVEIPLELYGGNVSSIVAKRTMAIDDDDVIKPLVYLMQNQYPYKAGVANGLMKSVFAADDALVSYNGTRYSGGIYSDVPFKELEPGDVIMYKTNDIGAMNTFRVLTRYKDLYDEEGKFVYREINTTDPTSSMYITCGKVIDIFDDYTFTYNIDPDMSISGLRYCQNGITAANMAVSIFDTSKSNPVRSGTLKDLRIGDNIVTRSESGNCLEVFIFRK